MNVSAIDTLRSRAAAVRSAWIESAAVASPAPAAPVIAVVPPAAAIR